MLLCNVTQLPAQTPPNEAGVTEAAGAPPGWSAQVGFGPLDSDPRVPTGWTYCDLNGAGANPAQAFSPSQLGLMTVTPP
jgi:hypothetical protein